MTDPIILPVFELFLPGGFVPSSYKMLGINNLAGKKFQQSSFYFSNVHFIYPTST